MAEMTGEQSINIAENTAQTEQPNKRSHFQQGKQVRPKTHDRSKAELVTN